MPQALTDEQIAAKTAEQEAANPVNNAPQYVNDLSDADKATIRKYVNENIEEIMSEAKLSTNNLCHLAQVSHGSIKSRGKSTQSAREIILGVINGTRAERKAMSVDSVTSFLSSLPPEEKEKILQQLLSK